MFLWTEQGGSTPSESSQSREASPMEGIIEDMQCRIRRLERWHTINTVLTLLCFFLLFAQIVWLSISWWRVPRSWSAAALLNHSFSAYVLVSGRCYGRFWCLPLLAIHFTNESANDNDMAFWVVMTNKHIEAFSATWMNCQMTWLPAVFPPFCYTYLLETNQPKLLTKV